MKKYSRFLKIVFLIIVILVGFHSTFSKYNKDTYKRLSNPIKRIENKPIGEITKSFKIKQKLVLKDIRNLPLENICVSILMANYCNRFNKGSFEIGLLLDDKKELIKVHASEIKDNAPHHVCFDNITTKDLTNSKSVYLIINGIDGVSGSSVTAWSTKDISGGHIQNIPNRSLIYKIEYKDSKSMKNTVSFIFTLFTVFAILLLVFPLLYQFYKEPNK